MEIVEQGGPILRIQVLKVAMTFYAVYWGVEVFNFIFTSYELTPAIILDTTTDDIYASKGEEGCEQHDSYITEVHYRNESTAGKCHFALVENFHSARGLIGLAIRTVSLVLIGIFLFLLATKPSWEKFTNN
jgi:hypothetical protein